MPVEVQRQEPMVSGNRSRENDYDSVTTNSPRSQCCDEVTMNVKVTGVPTRTKRMSISDDPRVGQFVATTVPKRGVGIQTPMYEKLHDSTKTSQHATRDPTTQQQGWRFGPVSPLRLDHTHRSRQDIHSTRVPITMERLWMARNHHN